MENPKKIIHDMQKKLGRSRVKLDNPIIQYLYSLVMFPAGILFAVVFFIVGYPYFIFSVLWRAFFGEHIDGEVTKKGVMITGHKDPRLIKWSEIKSVFISKFGPGHIYDFRLAGAEKNFVTYCHSIDNEASLLKKLDELDISYDLNGYRDKDIAQKQSQHDEK